MNVIATGDGALDKLQDRRDKTHGFRFQTVVPKLAFMTQSPANTTTFCIDLSSVLRARHWKGLMLGKYKAREISRRKKNVKWNYCAVGFSYSRLIL